MPKLPNMNDDPMAQEFPPFKTSKPAGKSPAGKPNPEPKAEPEPRKQPTMNRQPYNRDPMPRSLSVRVTRHYGAIDVEFGVAASFAVENEQDQKRLWRLLHDQVSGMHDDWARDELPNVQHIQPAGSAIRKVKEQAPADPIAPTVYTAASITVKGFGELATYRLKSVGDWTPYYKFGAKLTAHIIEVMENLGCEFPRIDGAEFDTTPYGLSFTVENGLVKEIIR